MNSIMNTDHLIRILKGESTSVSSILSFFGGVFGGVSGLC